MCLSFRLLLTRESYVIQMIAMEVLKQVMKAAQEDLVARKKLKLKGAQTAKLFPTRILVNINTIYLYFFSFF